MILFNIKLAIRNILKYRLNSFLIIGGFSIGFAAFILTGLYYYSEHRVNRDFTNYENIYRLYDKSESSYMTNYDLFPILADNFPEIEYNCPLMSMSNPEFTIMVKDVQLNRDARINDIASTNNNFFGVFDTEIIAGSPSQPFSGKESAVISESMAKKLYGDINPIGQTITIYNFLEATITAVMKDLPKNSSFGPEIMLNSDNENFRLFQACDDGKCKYLTNQFLMLNENINPDTFASRLLGSIETLGMDIKEPDLQKLSDIYLSTSVLEDTQAKGNPNMLFIFLVIAIIIILLSSINYMNYTISNQYSKLKEIGINKTIGAGWRQLVVYSVSEVTLGIFMSLIISAIVISIVLPYTDTLFGKDLRNVATSIPGLVPLFAVIVGAIVLLNSMVPVMIISRFKITEFFSGMGKIRKKQKGKQALLTFQLSVSIALIATVLIVFKQLNFIKKYDLGFDRELLVRMDLPSNNPNLLNLKQEVDKLSFVKGSTLSYGCPGMINQSMGSNSGDNSFMINCIYIGDDYLETMGIDLMKGRKPFNSDLGKVCLLNITAMNKFGWDNPDDKIFNNGREGGYEVVGVVNDFNVRSLHEMVSPTALIYDPRGDVYNILSVRLAAGNSEEQIMQLRGIWKTLITDESLNLTFYDDQYQAMYEKETKLSKSISFFSLIAIVLTCMGILGQIYMASISRIKEIGIRKVNGAKVSEILAMLNKDFVKWVVIAFIIACPIAWYAMNKWLENFAYKTELSWWIFVLAGLLALGIALLTVSWQSWRAATYNPVKALRYE